MERTVIVNSRFRAYRKDTSTNFNVLLNKGISVDDVDRIIVKRVSMPNMFYNVPVRKSILYMQVDGSNVNITITAGNYYIDRFVTALQAALQATVDPSATVTVDYDTGRLYLSYTASGTGWTILSHTAVKKQFGVDESLNDIVGTSYDTQEPESFTWISPEIIDLSGEHVVRIESSTLAFSSGFDSRGQILNVVDVVPISEGYGSTCHYQPSDHILSFVDSGNTGRQISSVDIQLVSDSGQILSLPDNAYVEIVLLVIFRNNTF